MTKLVSCLKGKDHRIEFLDDYSTDARCLKCRKLFIKRDNPCPKCKTGEIVVYSKPDGNYYACDSCVYQVTH